MSVINCTKDQNCTELDIELRKNLLGEKSTVRDAINKVLELSLPDTRSKRPPYNQSQIAELLGRTRQWVSSIVDIGINHKMIETDDTGKIQQPKLSELENWTYLNADDFALNPLVKAWIEDLLTKNGGKPKKTWKSNLIGLKKFCNTLQITPTQLIGDRSRQHFESMLKKLALRLQQNPETYDKSNKGLKSENWESRFHGLKMSARIFVQFHGVPLPKNIGGIASGKVIQHGQYADVRLSQIEIEKAKQYIIEKYGLDSDIFRVFMIGIQSGSRKNALLKMECQWEVHQGADNLTYFQMSAYETKTESNWKKYIYDKETQQSLILQKNRGEKFIISTRVATSTKSKEIIEQLRDVYRFLGKAELHNRYFMRKPFHALRHIAAQNWIVRLNGNLSIVASVCGWKSDIELIASYGELPAQLILSQIESSLKGVNTN